MSLPKLYLKPREEKRLLAGHLWVFSNEVDVKRSPIKGLPAGQQVTVCRTDGKAIGSAYVNSASLICARIYDKRADVKIDEAWLKHRIGDALQLRSKQFEQPYYRLVHGEGDYLPGLVIDCYDDVLVLQINTAGIEAVKTTLIEVLKELLSPRAILLRNDTPSRDLEQLPQHVDWVFGDPVPTVTLIEGGATFEADLVTGQKTGWFYDQRDNRKRALEFVKGAKVLDLFSYTGSWTVQAALAGATSVTAIDASQPAVDQLRQNAILNGVEERVTGICANAFDFLKSAKAEGQRFDVIVLDPPAFIKRKKDWEEGRAAYARANKLAMEVLAAGGILISASCSYHLLTEQLHRVVLGASRQVRRDLQFIHFGQQGLDHPVHPAIPETAYLKAVFCRLL